jgi:alpha-tubulin suppressor-like RCC1 family protein
MDDDLKKHWLGIQLLGVLVVGFISIIFANTAWAEKDGIMKLGSIGGNNHLIEVNGKYAYINKGSQFIILDISSPDQPVELGSVGVEPFLHLKVKGNYAYLAGTALQVVDVSNPTRPVLVYTDRTAIAGMDIEGDYLYTINYIGTMTIRDIKDGKRPEVVGEFAYRKNGVMMEALIRVSQSYAYIADKEDFSLHIIDVHNPSKPVRMNTLDFNHGQFTDIQVEKNHLYMSRDQVYTGYLEIYDISSPAQPQKISELETGHLDKILAANGKVYVSQNGNGVLVVDVNQPQKPMQQGSWQLYKSSWSELGQILDMELAGNYLLLATNTEGIKILDIRPQQPALAGELFVSGRVADWIFFDGYIVVAHDENRITVMKSNEYGQPTVVSALELTDTVNGFSSIAAEGNLIYTTGDSGTRVFDASSVTQLKEIGFVPEGADSIAVQDGYIYLSGANGMGLRVFDARNPKSIKNVYTKVHPSYSRLVLAGTYGYGLVDSDEGKIEVLDIRQPEKPVPIAELVGKSGDIVNFIVSGHELIVIETSGIRRWDIRNAASPREMDFAPQHFNRLVSVEAAGDYLFVGDINSLKVLDISGLPGLSVVSSIPVDANKALKLRGNQIFTADGNGEVSIFRFDHHQIRFEINHVPYRFEAPAIIKDGYTLVPLRGIFEALQANVKWDGATQTVSAEKDGHEITLKIGSKTATVDGKQVKLDVEAQLVGSYTMVPVRFVAEALDTVVLWDNATRLITISDKSKTGMDGSASDKEPATSDLATEQSIKNENIMDIKAGHSFTMALTAKGEVWTWGKNDLGQLGDGTRRNSLTPIKVDGLSGIKQIAAGIAHAAVLHADGTVTTWGYLHNGKDGRSQFEGNDAKVKAAGLSNVSAIYAGGYHTVALREDGTVWTWGRNQFGQLGIGTIHDVMDNQIDPVQVQSLRDVIKIAGGDSHNLALKKDGTVWAWGANGYGQSGADRHVPTHSPLQVPGLSDVKDIAAGLNHSLALKQDGTVWQWGSNVYNSSLASRDDSGFHFQPARVEGLSDIVAIASGLRHSVALKKDGTVWTWGINNNGELGDGTTVDRFTPVQVVGIKDVEALISAKDGRTIVRKTDGTFWAWGLNEEGQFGDGTRKDHLTPVQISFPN